MIKNNSVHKIKNNMQHIKEKYKLKIVETDTTNRNISIKNYGELIVLWQLNQIPTMKNWETKF